MESEGGRCVGWFLGFWWEQLSKMMVLFIYQDGESGRRVVNLG